jgi:epsin
MADDLGQTVADTLRSGFSLGKDLFKKTKNLALNVSEMEAKVKDATNGEAWGPSGTQLHELAMATGSQEDRAIIIQSLIRRFGETPENWRKTYKALNVWEYCLKNGARRFVEDACDHDFEIRKCLNFAFIEADTGRDQGLNVRNRAKIISELMKDKARLDAERDKSKQARERFHNGSAGGISSTDVGGSGGGRRAADFDEPSRRDDSPPRRESAAEARPRVSGEFQRDAPTFASTERSSAPKAAAAAPKQPQQTVGSLLDFDSPAPAVAPKVSSMDFFSSAPAPAADAGGWANFGASNTAPAPAASLPPIQQFGGGTWDAFGAAPAPAPTQQFGAPASNDFGNFQSSEPAKPAVDKKVAGLIDMDDLLGAKKTETGSGAAGKGTPMNAMKPMGATKMGQGSSGGFGAQGAFGASPMMPMGGAPSMGMGASAPMGQTMMNPQMGGMGMVGFPPSPFCLTHCIFILKKNRARLSCCFAFCMLTRLQGMGNPQMGMGGGMNPQMGMGGGMGMVTPLAFCFWRT